MYQQTVSTRNAIMKKLLKSLFDSQQDVPAPVQQAVAKEHDIFGHDYAPGNTGMEVEELSFDEYMRMVKQEKLA